jgi:hypothetical protein
MHRWKGVSDDPVEQPDEGLFPTEGILDYLIAYEDRFGSWLQGSLLSMTFTP